MVSVLVNESHSICRRTLELTHLQSIVCFSRHRLSIVLYKIIHTHPILPQNKSLDGFSVKEKL